MACHSSDSLRDKSVDADSLGRLACLTRDNLPHTSNLRLKILVNSGGEARMRRVVLRD
jgi:hypothetical protein